jgi:hypothetical protein
MNYTRVKHDTSGSPRIVFHFLNFITENDKRNNALGDLYFLALKRAKKIGGKKFHNQTYGGGIVFQSYEPTATIEAIKNLMENYDN